MKTKVGINGFGRIGRLVLKAIDERYGDKLEVVAVNAGSDVSVYAHLFKCDSSYGMYPGSVTVDGGDIVVDGKTIKVFSEKDPGKIPWSDKGVDIVIEATGVFRDKIGNPAKGKPGVNVHIENGGAKKVIITAPGKNVDCTIVWGVNEEKYDPANHHVVSNASCTTNCLAPAVKVIHDNWTVLRGMMTTIHSYTTDQRVLDQAHSDLRRARAAAMNIIPTSTGAAKALALIIPDLKGKFNGFSLRVPTPTVSIVDIVVNLEKPTSVKKVNAAFKGAAEGSLKGILGYTDEPLVSMDFKGDSRSSIVDGQLTMVLNETMVKVVTWYDNEWGYSCRTADLAAFMAAKL